MPFCRVGAINVKPRFRDPTDDLCAGPGCIAGAQILHWPIVGYWAPPEIFLRWISMKQKWIVSTRCSKAFFLRLLRYYDQNPLIWSYLALSKVAYHHKYPNSMKLIIIHEVSATLQTLRWQISRDLGGTKNCQYYHHYHDRCTSSWS